MKKASQVALGIVTGIGGFLEIGTTATSAEAGASFRFSLIWSLVLGTICLIFLIEMTGRHAAVSKHSLAGAVRERFGFPFSVVPRLAELIVNLLLLAAEIGGVAFSIKLLTGVSIQILAIPIALVVWLLIWLGTLDIIENSTAGLGLLAIAFVVAAFKLHPPIAEVARGFVPSLPHHDAAHYWFLVISIIGANVSPYMFYFYSSGAIEEKWDEKSLGMNRVTAIVGMGFGALIAMTVIICSAMVFEPRNIQIETYEQIAFVLVPALGKWGVPLFAVILGVCCFGAAAEIDLSSAYALAQMLGWNWGEDKKPANREARFALTYSVMIVAGGIIMVTGIDPLKLTMLTMGLTAVVLPLAIIPFIIIMNDEHYLGEHTNGPIGNTVIVVTIVLTAIIAVVTIPLEIMGGG
jgi:Mn2+/Fe2+ NRAMP family transporter